ncbi:hypothetical protein NDU88_007528 [Pleurodeles waltl]|uniref:Uncharacterized protein n=1 Tax=Pleurodeles waltl TaxID=8319 RepID=A0AAV7RS17_PLEWA|nr:hypothetical protein NDU88_007528 [Pleurodeles waltl]
MRPDRIPMVVLEKDQTGRCQSAWPLDGHTFVRLHALGSISVKNIADLDAIAVTLLLLGGWCPSVTLALGMVAAGRLLRPQQRLPVADQPFDSESLTVAALAANDIPRQWRTWASGWGALVPSDAESSKSRARGACGHQGRHRPKDQTAPEKRPPCGRGRCAARQQAIPDWRDPSRTTGTAPGGAAPSAAAERGPGGRLREKTVGPRVHGSGAEKPLNRLGPRVPPDRTPGARRPTHRQEAAWPQSVSGAEGCALESCAIRNPGRQHYVPRAWAAEPGIQAPMPCWALAPLGRPSADCAPGLGGAEATPVPERGARAEERGRGDEEE